MKNSPRNQLRRCNVPPNHRPSCSSISQQHCHPQARHDSSRNKGQCRLTHNQGFPISQTHTAGFYQVIKELGQAKCQAGGLNTNILMHTAAKQPIHSSLKKAKTTRDNPKQNMSIAQVHKTTQSCSWPQRGQNNSTATPKPRYFSNPTSQ